MWLYSVKSVDYPSVWSFKWKLLSNIFKWCCLLLTILQNQIQDFFLSFELSTLGSKRVKATEPEAHLSFLELMLSLMLVIISQVLTRHTDEDTCSSLETAVYVSTRFKESLNAISYKTVIFYFISLWSLLIIELTLELRKVAHYLILLTSNRPSGIKHMERVFRI